MKKLFFDTETTGLSNDKKPATDPCQPMPMQIGMRMDGENRKNHLVSNYYLRSQGWEPGKKAVEVHGITTDMSKDFGLHFITGVETFLDAAENVDMLVAHNIRYDMTVMRRACKVYSEIVGEPYIDPFEGKQLFCTMMACIDIVKAPPKRNGQWKWPRLEECVKFFWNEKLDGAHDALIDVNACARVFYHLEDEGLLR